MGRGWVPAHLPISPFSASVQLEKSPKVSGGGVATFETCFLLKNDGKGSDLGDGDIENADPAYSRLPEEITRRERNGSEVSDPDLLPEICS